MENRARIQCDIDAEAPDSPKVRQRRLRQAPIERDQFRPELSSKPKITRVVGRQAAYGGELHGLLMIHGDFFHPEPGRRRNAAEAPAADPGDGAS